MSYSSNRIKMIYKKTMTFPESKIILSNVVDPLRVHNNKITQ